MAKKHSATKKEEDGPVFKFFNVRPVALTAPHNDWYDAIYYDIDAILTDLGSKYRKVINIDIGWNRRLDVICMNFVRTNTAKHNLLDIYPFDRFWADKVIEEAGYAIWNAVRDALFLTEGEKAATKEADDALAKLHKAYV